MFLHNQLLTTVCSQIPSSHNISCSLKTDLPVNQLRSDFITVYHLAGLNSEAPPTISVAMAPYQS